MGLTAILWCIVCLHSRVRAPPTVFIAYPVEPDREFGESGSRPFDADTGAVPSKSGPAASSYSFSRVCCFLKSRLPLGDARN